MLSVRRDKQHSCKQFTAIYTQRFRHACTVSRAGVLLTVHAQEALNPYHARVLGALDDAPDGASTSSSSALAAG